MAPLMTRLSAVRNLDHKGIIHEPNFRPLCCVKVNGVKVNALIDSGNLVGVAISEAFAHELLGKDLRSHITPITDEVRTCK